MIGALVSAYHCRSPGARVAFERLLYSEDPQKAEHDFLAFVRAVWPQFIHGSHHDIMEPRPSNASRSAHSSALSLTCCAKPSSNCSASDLFSSGMVYTPLGRRWVEMVRQEFAEFPNGEFDDLPDAGVWRLMRIRRDNLIRLASDEIEEEWQPRAPRENY
jgi:hypothetical protein